MTRYIKSWQEKLVFMTDVFITAFCYMAAYFIRFDGAPPAEYLITAIKTLPFMLCLRMLGMIYFKLNKGLWQYASIKDLMQIIKTATVSSLVIIALIMVFRIKGVPRSIFIIDWLLLTVALSGARFFIRLSRPLRGKAKNGNGHRKKVLIVGAGDAGEMIIREMIYRYNHNYEPVGIVDDDPLKYKRSIHGAVVLGTRSDIPKIVKQNNVREIVIAIPSLKSDQMRDIVGYCMKSGAKYRTVPNISNVMDGTVKVRELREVRLEDLLKRDEVFLDKEKLAGYIKNKRVLVTGAGGSIGSELCRQVARLSPSELILFEKGENALFYIDMELGQFFKQVNKAAVVGDMRDRARVKEVFRRYKPQVIFHAAAHKHVPLMEINSMEAIKNNVFGTKVLAEEALEFGVERFIMLSTDKAVEPTSLMGVSKRITEIYISALNNQCPPLGWTLVDGGTKFTAVRFGNVMGSEGSVIPTFKKQIERGGPITITHPEIKRYFMTIPEAAGLVLEAGLIGKGGEIFILEMGRQIKILDLAKDLIELSGLTPDQDINIEITGLRPGEKMYEALFSADEKLIKTEYEKLLIVRPKRKITRDIFEDIRALEEIVRGGNMRALVDKLKEIVPEYKPEGRFLNMPQKEQPKTNDIDILIADDDEIVRDLLHKFLEGRGYNTLLASDGKEALEWVERNNISAAIVDIKMPGFIDGLKVLKQIKRKNKNIGVINITGFGTKKTRRLSNALGACAYLEKPFDLLDIKNHVEKALVETVGV